ncbi:methyltransferase domain-containing protein [Desulfovibrio sp. OttesenSCG-928-I05]|nr:methyltransferase domain-containing protein [Desulfovibrio sp. OttesenSCG-928-I05]
MMKSCKHFMGYMADSSKTTMRVVQPYIGFAYNLLTSPREVGAVCPSSPALASVLVDASKACAFKTDGLVIDLGAGSGVVTRKLLERGVPPRSIVAIDRSPSFARVVGKRFPGVAVLCEDAKNLAAAVKSARPGERVKTVISSLPFRSLPGQTRKAVADGIMGVLRQQGGCGCLVQFSYFWWDQYPLARYGFIPRSRRFVFWNVPPAVVEVYTVPE